MGIMWIEQRVADFPSRKESRSKYRSHVGGWPSGVEGLVKWRVWMVPCSAKSCLISWWETQPLVGTPAGLRFKLPYLWDVTLSLLLNLSAHWLLHLANGSKIVSTIGLLWGLKDLITSKALRYVLHLCVSYLNASAKVCNKIIQLNSSLNSAWLIVSYQ